MKQLTIKQAQLICLILNNEYKYGGNNIFNKKDIVNGKIYISLQTDDWVRMTKGWNNEWIEPLSDSMKNEIKDAITHNQLSEFRKADVIEKLNVDIKNMLNETAKKLSRMIRIIEEVK